MFHKLIKVDYLKGTTLEATFQDGKIMQYDVSVLFEKYPILKNLQDHKLFCSGKTSAYGIRWDDDLDLEAETIYQDGKFICTAKLPVKYKIAYMVNSARLRAGLSQSKLSELTGIDQADISKIESAQSNPSILTLERIAKALKVDLSISMQ